QNDYAAVAGRLKPLQQRLADMERQQVQAPAAPAPQGPPEDIAALFDREDWKQYAASFPDEANAFAGILTGAVTATETRLRQQIAHLEQRVAGIAPLVEQVAEREQQSEYERSLRVLTEPHPDYQQVNASPEFQQWLRDEYPRTLPAIIRRDMQDESYRKQVFSDPASVADILTLYKASRQPAPTAAPPAPTPVAQPAAPKVDPRLALSAAPSVPSGGVRAPKLTDLTPEQQFLAGYNSA
ncbi:MAG: hypothetical protein ACRCSN_00455, partial [Dermatophilaceae bacterium]